MRIVFFSDTHLDRAHTEKTKTVETFIREVCSGADMVFLLGDFFEFYHGYRDYIYPWYRGVADALREITTGGTTVYLVEGNHEFGAGGFLESYAGITCTDAMSIEVDGKKVFVSHGDELEGKTLRVILKSRVAALAMNLLGPRLTWAAAMRARVFLSKREKPYNLHAAEDFRGYALRLFDEGYDAVVLAHSHTPDTAVYGSGDKEKVYLNTGDFCRYSTYVLYDSSSGFELKGRSVAPRRE
jgi:UDP-2,3-diacylglucosamine hydrolase